MVRRLGFAPFAVARFRVPSSFAEPSLCGNVAIALVEEGVELLAIATTVDA